MAKSSITKNLKLSAKGILSIEDGFIGIENADTGTMIDMQDLLFDFKDKPVSLIISYDEDY